MALAALATVDLVGLWKAPARPGRDFGVRAATVLLPLMGLLEKSGIAPRFVGLAARTVAKGLALMVALRI